MMKYPQGKRQKVDFLTWIFKPTAQEKPSPSDGLTSATSQTSNTPSVTPPPLKTLEIALSSVAYYHTAR